MNVVAPKQKSSRLIPNLLLLGAVGASATVGLAYIAEEYPDIAKTSDAISPGLLSSLSVSFYAVKT